MSNTELWPGWETVRLIGRGSFGAVYEIERDVLGEKEKAALKVITIPQNSSDVDELYGEGYDDESITNTFKAYLKSIVAEYSMMRKMNGSANVVNCDDVHYVQHDDGFGWDIFIKMELLTPLTKALGKEISDEQVIRIGTDICKALILCKKHNIIHRDIKPANIFVSENGDYKLGDFGIAKTAEKTSGGTKIGTYEYMAPEVYHDQPYGNTVDIYSLGMVLYWLLNERRTPFLKMPPALPTKSEKEQARKRRFSGEDIPAPKHGSKELKRIILKACAFDQKERYQSADEMADDLAKLSDLSIPPIPARTEQIPVDSEAETDAMTGSYWISKGKNAEDKPEENTAGAPAPESPEEKDEKTISALLSGSMGSVQYRHADHTHDEEPGGRASGLVGSAGKIESQPAEPKEDPNAGAKLDSELMGKIGSVEYRATTGEEALSGAVKRSSGLLGKVGTAEYRPETTGEPEKPAGDSVMGKLAGSVGSVQYRHADHTHEEEPGRRPSRLAGSVGKIAYQPAEPREDPKVGVKLDSELLGKVGTVEYRATAGEEAPGGAVKHSSGLLGKVGSSEYLTELAPEGGSDERRPKFGILPAGTACAVPREAAPVPSPARDSARYGAGAAPMTAPMTAPDPARGAAGNRKKIAALGAVVAVLIIFTVLGVLLAVRKYKDNGPLSSGAIEDASGGSNQTVNDGQVPTIQPGGGSGADQSSQPGGGSGADQSGQPGGGSGADQSSQPGGGGGADQSGQPGGGSGADQSGQPGGGGGADQSGQPGTAPTQDPNQRTTAPVSAEERDAAFLAYAELLHDGIMMGKTDYRTLECAATHYYLVDMNGDGLDELIVYGSPISLVWSFEIYTYQNGRVRMIADSYSTCDVSAWNNAAVKILISDGVVHANIGKSTAAYSSTADYYLVYDGKSVINYRSADSLPVPYGDNVFTLISVDEEYGIMIDSDQDFLKEIYLRNHTSSLDDDLSAALADGNYYGLLTEWTDDTMTVELLNYEGRYEESFNYILTPTGEYLKLNISQAVVCLEWAWNNGEEIVCQSIEDALNVKLWDSETTLRENSTMEICFTVRDGIVTKIVFLYAA